MEETKKNLSVPIPTIKQDFSESQIEKYILYCKLKTENRVKHSKTNIDFKDNYSRCLEKYYTLCLRDVSMYNQHEYNRLFLTQSKEPFITKSFDVCDKIIDVYTKTHAEDEK